MLPANRLANAVPRTPGSRSPLSRYASPGIGPLTLTPVRRRSGMGFNRRKMEADRKAKVDADTVSRRATDGQVVEDAERLIGAWNDRQARRMPMLFSPTIGAAIYARYWYLWVLCPACRTVQAVDLRKIDRHRDAAVTGLVPALSCRSCRPNAPFADLVRLSRTSIADEMRIDHTRRMLGE